MKSVYLEPDEEIISVIEKLSKESAGQLAVVIPKGSSLGSSLVNLRLLEKEAKKLGKKLVIISRNKVCERLAKQVGLTVFANPPISEEGESRSSDEGHSSMSKEAHLITEKLPDGTEIHRFVSPVIGGDELVEEETREKESAVSSEETDKNSLGSQPPQLPEKRERIGFDTVKRVPLPEKKETSPASPTPETPAAERPWSGGSTQDTGKLEPSAQPESISAEEERAELPAISDSHPGFRSNYNAKVHMPWKSLLAAGGFLAVASVLVFLFLPKAKVTLVFPATPVTKTVSVSAQISPDNGALTIQGNLLESEQNTTKTITATGKKDVGTKAAGSVTFYNKASSSPASIAAGATLTGSGKTFLLDKSVTIPGASVAGGSVVAGQATGSITAGASGDSYNLSSAQFSISGQSSLVYATGSTTGGSTKTVTVLSQDDVDKAISDAKAELTTSATNDLKTKSIGQTLLDDSIWQKVKTQTVDQAVGAQVSQAALSLTIDYGAIVINQTDAQNKLKETLSSDIASDKQLVVQEDQTVMTYKSVNNEHNIMTLTVAGKGYIIPKLDKQIVARQIKNKNITDAKAMLTQQYKTDSVDIKIVPSWWVARLPIFPQAIEVNYGYDEAAGT